MRDAFRAVSTVLNTASMGCYFDENNAARLELPDKVKTPAALSIFPMKKLSLRAKNGFRQNHLCLLLLGVPLRLFYIYTYAYIYMCIYSEVYTSIGFEHDVRQCKYKHPLLPKTTHIYIPGIYIYIYLYTYI